VHTLNITMLLGCDELTIWQVDWHPSHW